MNYELVEKCRSDIGYFTKYYFGETYKRIDSVYPRCPVFDSHVTNYIAWLVTYKTHNIHIMPSEKDILHIIMEKVAITENVTGKIVHIDDGIQLGNQSTIRISDEINCDVLITKF